MRIELIKDLTQCHLDSVQWQIQRIKDGKSDELWFLTPHEDATYLVEQMGLPPEKVYDVYAQQYLQTYQPYQGIWWSQLNVPNDAQLVIQSNLTKQIISQGHVVAQMRWFMASNRRIQSVTWLDQDEQIDYQDVYQRNGQLFARQCFSEGAVLSSDFYFGQSDVVLRQMYDQGQANLVIRDDNIFNQRQDYLRQILTDRIASHQVNMTQIELAQYLPENADTQLTLINSILDHEGNVNRQLLYFLNDYAVNFQSIRLNPYDYEIIKSENILQSAMYDKIIIDEDN